MQRAAPWSIGLLFAAPVLFARFPPMADLPFHEAVVGVLRHFNDRTYFPEGLYRLNLGHPNQAFYLFAWIASLVVSVPLACKLVAAAAIALVPAGGAVLARYLGRSVWVACLVAPLAIGWLFAWGVVGNILGLALLLAVLPTLDRANEQPSMRGAWLSFGSLLLLYFAHEAMLLVGCAAVGMFALLKPMTRRETSLRLAPLAPLLALAILQLRLQEPFRTQNNREVPIITRPLLHKLANVPGVLCYEPALRWTIFGCALIPIAWLAVERRRRRAPGEQLAARESLHRFRFEALAVVLLVAYFAFPFSLNGATLVYQRFLAPAYAIGVIALAPAASGTELPRILRLLLVASPLTALFAMLPSYFESNRSYRAYEKLLARVPNGAAYLNVDLDPPTPYAAVRPLGLQGHAVALRGGRSEYDITQSPIAPAVLSPAYRWSESTSRLQHDSKNFVPAYDFRLFRYVFVHAKDLQLELIADGLLRLYSTPVAAAGEWSLYESDLPTAPITAPDAPAPPSSAVSIHALKLEDVRKPHGTQGFEPEPLP